MSASMPEVTLDLEDRVEEIEARIADLREEQDAIEADGESLPEPTADGGQDESDEATDPAQRRQELREEYRGLEEDIRALRNTKGVLEDKIEEWNGSRFEIRRFSFGDQANANDLFLTDMNREGKQSPEEAFNARKIRIVQVGVRESPPDAPDHPRQFPPAIGEWLYESIEDLNTYGEVGLDDFSLPSTLTET